MNKKLRFKETDNRLKTEEYFDLLSYFNRNLVIGLELERAVDIRPETLASNLKTTFVSYGSSRGDSSLGRYKRATTNFYNVAHCSTDATVRYGNEIIFNGTAENFKWVHTKLKELEKKLTSLRCLKYDQSCSNHITAITLQEKPIRSVLLKNIFNLSRAFSTSLFWLCSGHNGGGRQIVRQTILHNAKPNLSVSPFGKSVRELSMTGKYSLCNISKQTTISFPQEMLSGLLVEFRNPDGFRIPSALTSLMFFYRALIYKALDLSLTGVAEVESLVNWEENKRLTKKITEDYSLSEAEEKKVIKQSHDLLDFLTPQLKLFGDEAMGILRQLADKPISKRSKSLKTIESQLTKRFNKKMSKNETKVVNMIVNQEIKKKTALEYKKEVASLFGVTIRMVEYMLKNIERKANVNIVFDNQIETYRIS